MKNTILVLIFIMLSFSLLNSVPFIFLSRSTSWNPQSNGMGRSYLSGSQTITSVLYNPAQLADTKQTEIGLYNRLNVGSYDYYVPSNDDPFYGNEVDVKKAKIKPTFKISALSSAFPIYQSQNINIGMGLAYQNYDDYTQKIENADHSESSNKGGFNTLSSGFGISYQNKYKIGASYHNSFQSVYKYSYNNSDSEVNHHQKSITSGNFVLLSGAYKYYEDLEFLCSYKMVHTRYGESMNSQEIDILSFGIKKSFAESEITFQASVPFYSKYYGNNDDGLVLNLGANHNLNQNLNLQIGSYYESTSLMTNQFETVYGFTSGVKVKSLLPVDLYVSLDYAFQNSTYSYNDIKEDERTDLFSVYSGLCYTFQKGK